MNQFADRAIRHHFGSLRVKRTWLLVFLGLSCVTGWYVPDIAGLSTSNANRVAGAVLFPLFLVGSLAVHELGHYLASTRWPLPTTYRSLYLSGSTPRGLNLPGAAFAEISNAAMGPVASVLLSGLFLSPLFFLADDSPVRALLLAGAVTNVLIAGVNVLPSIPFDGGRIFMAVFGFFHSNQQAGTRAGFLYSQIIAAGSLGFGGFLLAWSSDYLVPGLWCVALGAMIAQASRSELVQSSLIARASALRAADAVTGLNPTIRVNSTVSEAIDILLEQQGNGPGLIRDRDRFVGTVTLQMMRDVPRARWDEASVRDVMVPLDQVVDSEPNASLLDVLRVCDSLNLHAIVVRHGNGDIAGLVSDEIDATTLLHRAEDRSVDRTNARSARKSHHRS